MLPNWAEWFARVAGELLAVAGLVVVALVGLAVAGLVVWAFVLLCASGLGRRYDRVRDPEPPEVAAPERRRFFEEGPP